MAKKSIPAAKKRNAKVAAAPKPSHEVAARTVLAAASTAASRKADRDGLGWRELMPVYLDRGDPDEIADCVEGVRLPLVCGIRAIGMLMTDASNSTTGNVSEVAEDLGYLIAALAECLDHLSDMSENAWHQKFARAARVGAEVQL